MKGIKSTFITMTLIMGLCVAQSAMAGCQVDLKFKHSNEGKTYTISKVKVKVNSILVPDAAAATIDGLSGKQVTYGSPVTKSYTAAICAKHEFTIYWNSENGNEHSKVVTKDLEDGGNYTFSLKDN